MNDFTDSELEYLELTRLMLEEGMIQSNPPWRLPSHSPKRLDTEEQRITSIENIKRIIELTSKLKLNT